MSGTSSSIKTKLWWKSLDGPLPKWCPAVALSRQDGRHSAVALLLKAALIQVSDYRLLGASGLFCVIALQSINLELPPFFILCDCIAIYLIGVTSLFYFARLHCNLLNWSYLPFLFCVIALQSINFGVASLFYFAWLHCNLLILELPPFFILCDCIAIY